MSTGKAGMATTETLIGMSIGGAEPHGTMNSM